jgi:hypothetical protein
MARVSLWIAVLAAAVAAACSGGDGGATPTSPSASTSSGATPPQANCTMPSAPANLHVDSLQGTTVSLAWSAVSGATEYIVLIGSTSGSSNELSTNTSQTNYSYGGAKPGVHYARVQAKNACGSSGSSNTVEYIVAG